MTPSLESITMLMVQPEAYRDSTGLDGHILSDGVEGIEHDLNHFLTVGFGVQGRS